jgi:hypothetical protein
LNYAEAKKLTLSFFPSAIIDWISLLLSIYSQLSITIICMLSLTKHCPMNIPVFKSIPWTISKFLIVFYLYPHAERKFYLNCSTIALWKHYSWFLEYYFSSNKSFFKYAEIKCASSKFFYSYLFGRFWHG